MERVRRYFASGQTLTGGATSDKAIPLLSPRARQMPVLFGYRMMVRAIGGLALIGEQVANHLLLLAGQPPDSGEFVGIGPGAFNSVQQASRILDSFVHSYRVPNTTSAVGVTVIQPDAQSDWVNTELVVPGLALYAAQFSQSSINASFAIVLEYEWRDFSPADIAKVYLQYSLDPQDFDRRNAEN